MKDAPIFNLRTMEQWIDEEFEQMYFRPNPLTNRRMSTPNGLDRYLSKRHGTKPRKSGGYREILKHHGYILYGARTNGVREALWNHPKGTSVSIWNQQGIVSNRFINTRGLTWMFSIELESLTSTS